MLIVVGILAPISNSFEIQEAGAFDIFGAAGDALSLVQETISATSLTALELKEFTLDGIAYSLAKKAVSQMTSNIVDWINSGFEGNPMFITDLGGFLTDVADQVAGDYLYELAGDLCSPFQLNVTMALKIQRQQAQSGRTQCTFSGAVDNLANFAQGFSNWGEWFEITVRPENNVYGAMLIAQVELDQRITNALGIEKEQLGWNAGFMSQKKCETVQTASGAKQQCSIVTPGVVIAEQLNKNLDSGREALITADEIDEVISALFAQLAEQAMTGVNGLLGLSAGAGGSSYLDQVGRGEGESIGFRYSDENLILTGINKEEKAAGILRNILSLIENAEAQIDANCSLSLTSTLEDAGDVAEGELASSNIVLATLYNLNAQYNATTDPTVQSNLSMDYLELESANYLYSDLEVRGLESTLEEIRTEVKKFEDEIADEC